MISYNEILEAMKNAYFDQCGENPDMQGDIGIRFKAVASELFDLGVYADYVMKQSCLDTATGEYLDNIARECNLKRQTPKKATGWLTFYIDEEMETDLIIPVDTICSNSKSKYLQYITTEQGVIKAGTTRASVDAMAMECGEEYNCGNGSVDTIVNPFTGISGVKNYGAFSGGTSGESNTRLRNRIYAYLENTNNGISQKALENRIMNIDGVMGCCISNNYDNIVIAVKTATDNLTDEIYDSVDNEAKWLELFSVYYSIELAYPVYVSSKVLCSKEVDKDEITTQVKNYLNSLNVADVPSELGFERYLKDNTNIEVMGLQVKFSYATITKTNYAFAGDVEVEYYD